MVLAGGTGRRFLVLEKILETLGPRGDDTTQSHCVRCVSWNVLVLTYAQVKKKNCDSRKSDDRQTHLTHTGLQVRNFFLVYHQERRTSQTLSTCNMSLDFLGLGGYRPKNPPPLYEDQCLYSPNSKYPMIAVRISRGVHRGELQWKSAPVACGFAQDGGLQDIVLEAVLSSRIAAVYVDPAVLAVSDQMGAIKTTMNGIFGEGKYKIFDTSIDPPPEGVAVIKLGTASDVNVVLSAPTRTALYYDLLKSGAIEYPTWMSSRALDWIP